MNNKKILAAKVLGTTPEKVKFAQDSLEEIRKAITRSDIRGLVAVGKITADKTSHQSRGRARQKAAQKRKGRQKGKGSRKGMAYARLPKKRRWINSIRVQRAFLKELRDKGLLTIENYHLLKAKSKGGYFRNKRHIKLYLNEHHLTNQAESRIENKVSNLGENKPENKKGAY